MPDISQADPNGVVRQAHTALRTLGGCIALLRKPGLAASGDDAEQLGLATPAFQDVSLGAVAFQKTSSDSKLMVSAAAVLQIVQTMAYDSADVLFATAAGVLIDGTLYVITSVVTAEAKGKPYSYLLTLQTPCALNAHERGDIRCRTQRIRFMRCCVAG